MKLEEAIEAFGNVGHKPNQRATKNAGVNGILSKQAKNRTPSRQAINWRKLCPELAKLEKMLESANPISKVAKRLDDSAALLNRWGHPDAHTLKWIEDDAVARIRIEEEFAHVPTQDFNRPDPTTVEVQKQAHDEDFVLDQGFSTGETDRLLREQDRRVIAKAHSTAGISVASEYLRRDSRGGVNGPLDMGIMAVSDLDG